ncbi:unnamed protein product [Cochlearia groenlandica]
MSLSVTVANSNALHADKQHMSLLRDMPLTAKMQPSMSHSYSGVYTTAVMISWRYVRAGGGLSAAIFDPIYPEVDDLINRYG